MADAKNRKTTFKFLNFTNPTDTQQTAKVRKQVRSHVSSFQHRQARARLREATQSRSADRDLDAQGNNTSQHHGDTADSSTPCTASVDQRLASLSTHDSVDQADSTKNDDYLEQVVCKSASKATLCFPEPCQITSGSFARSFSRGSLSFRTFGLHDPHHVMGTSLRDMRLELSSVMSLYKSICEVQAPEFARQYAIGDAEGSWGRFYTFVYTDPILLSVAVLLGARNLLDVLGIRIEGKTFAGILQIERFLMRSISDVLGDPHRGISDQILVAVALCAAYEIKHGSSTCYHTHMQGLIQMINLRGGLISIGSPDPYIVRLLVWQDINTSRIAVCRPYLAKMANGLTKQPLANTAVYRSRGLDPLTRAGRLRTAIEKANNKANTVIE